MGVLFGEKVYEEKVSQIVSESSINSGNMFHRIPIKYHVVLL